jgi:hypothetical protein
VGWPLYCDSLATGGSGERLHWACEAFLAAVLALPRAPTRWFFWLVLFLTPAGGKQR